jgi:hypothetical protein
MGKTANGIRFVTNVRREMGPTGWAYRRVARWKDRDGSIREVEGPLNEHLANACCYKFSDLDFR